MLPSTMEPLNSSQRSANNKSNNGTSHRYRSSSNSNFSIQRIKTDSTIAKLDTPLIRTVTAPFAKSDRKRAYVSASYYAECALQGVIPTDADTAAIDAQQRYERWWQKAKYKEGKEIIKRRKRDHHVKKKHHDIDMLSSQSDTTTSSSRNSTTEESPSNHGESEAHVLSEVESTKADIERNKRLLERGRNDSEIVREVSVSARYNSQEISACKQALLSELNRSKGDTESPTIVSYLQVLQCAYQSRGWDLRWTAADENSASPLDGNWLTLSKPTFSDCQGENEQGDYLYTLGRLSFEMFRPTGLECSIQGVYNTIRIDDNPQNVERAAKQRQPIVRKYEIVVALTISGEQTRRGQKVTSNNGEYAVPRPIRALLTNHGYCVPDPDVRNRLTMWFTGGSLEVQDEEKDLDEWKRLFEESSIPNRNLAEYARVLAARILLGAKMPDGMDDDGKMSYSLKRPIGGHTQVFCDVLYADDSLRILKGHHGSTFVFARVPDP